MSVENEILRIQHNIANAYAAVSGKGGEVPLQPTSANLAAAVESIPQTSGTDGNPVGTVISFLGLTAPAGYLVCDGTAHSISDYPALADFFRQQFGAANHFGGDGTSTFSVPDMRNLFLRGYRGEAEEQLSGEVGVLQPGTSIPYFMSGNAPAIQVGFVSQYGQVTPKNCDSTEGSGADGFHNLNKGGGTNIPVKFTTRPVNMAVLYCIKAVEADGGTAAAGDVYSTEEKRIGTWIDGKPLYRRVVTFQSPSASDKKEHLVYDFGQNCVVLNVISVLKNDETTWSPAPYCWPGMADASTALFWRSSGLYMSVGLASNTNKPVRAIVEYTKTTD